MAMIVISDKGILQQNEGESFGEFLSRVKVWNSSQPGSQPKCKPCGDTGFVQDEHGRERCKKCSQPKQIAAGAGIEW